MSTLTFTLGGDSWLGCIYMYMYNGSLSASFAVLPVEFRNKNSTRTSRSPHHQLPRPTSFPHPFLPPPSPSRPLRPQREAQTIPLPHLHLTGRGESCVYMYIRWSAWDVKIGLQVFTLLCLLGEKGKLPTSCLLREILKCFVCEMILLARNDNRCVHVELTLIAYLA